MAGSIVVLVLACCPTALAANVYVSASGQTVSDPGIVSQFGVGAGGNLSPLAPPSVAGGAGGSAAVVVSPDGHHVYATNPGSGVAPTVSQYAVGAGGALSPLTPSTVPVTGRTTAIAVTPDGRNLYATDRIANTMLQFSIAADGTLSPLSPPTVDVPGFSFGEMVVSPDGHNVYLVNGDKTITRFSVAAADGALTLMPDSVATGVGPFRIAISPDGQNVYVGNDPASSVSEYTVAADGSLSPLATIAANGASTMAVSPNGTSVYVGSGNSIGTLFQFTRGPGGVLSPKTPSSVATGAAAGNNISRGVAVSADGSTVYHANSDGSVSQYAVGPGGVLSPLSPSPVATGLDSASAIAVSPLPASASVSLSVQASASVKLGGSVSALAFLSGGAGATGTVSFDVYGPGDTTCASSLASSSAVVSGNGTYSSASFTPSVPGAYVFVARYGGDATHAAVGPTSCSAVQSTVLVGALAPALASSPASAVTVSSASLSGTVNPGGAATSVVFEYGTTLAFGSITAPVGAGSGVATVPVTASLTALSATSTYFYRPVATNSVGTTFGPVRTFSTGSGAPVVTTGVASQIANTTVSLAAQVNPNGQATAYAFEYGVSTSFGALSTVVQLDDAQAGEPVGTSLSGLTPDSRYFYRVVATNAAGTSVGSVMSFTTGPGGAPIVASGLASAITSTGALLAGTVNPRGSQTAFTFAYGTSPSNLGSITAVDNAGSEPGVQAIALPAGGLQPTTTYYYRLVAANANGTAFGAIRSFTTGSAT